MRWLFPSVIVFLIGIGAFTAYLYISKSGDSVATQSPLIRTSDATASSLKAKAITPSKKQSPGITKQVVENIRDGERQATGTIYPILLIILSITTLLAIAVTFYLYRS